MRLSGEWQQDADGTFKAFLKSKRRRRSSACCSKRVSPCPKDVPNAQPPRTTAILIFPASNLLHLSREHRKIYCRSAIFVYKLFWDWKLSVNTLKLSTRNGGSSHRKSVHRRLWYLEVISWKLVPGREFQDHRTSDTTKQFRAQLILEYSCPTKEKNGKFRFHAKWLGYAVWFFSNKARVSS